jgi:threonine dehydrogenase-like Zn-dependent dehydrogenase
MTSCARTERGEKFGEEARMKAVVWHGVGDIRLEDVEKPTIERSGDAVVRLTRSALCGTDLHMIRGTMPGMREGTILGHEGVGVVEEVGSDVRNFRPGDRVVLPSTLGCGSCSYCRAGYFAQCDTINPNGPQAGTSFYGGPASTGSFDGMQAEYVRVPAANVNMVAVPNPVGEDQAILASDILPTAWFGARLAEVSSGDAVAVFGCGPVGLLAILSARLQGASRILAVDTEPTRLERARELHAEAIDFNADDPVVTIRSLTGGIGVDRVIDAVGVDSYRPDNASDGDGAEQQAEVEQLLGASPGGQWRHGTGPSVVARWSVEAVAKAGSIGIIGVYPPGMDHWPLGTAFNKNLTVRMGNCNHRRYLPRLLDLLAGGSVDIGGLTSQTIRLDDVVDSYRHFDRQEPGWTKVAIVPDAGDRAAAAAAGERAMVP